MKLVMLPIIVLLSLGDFQAQDVVEVDLVLDSKIEYLSYNNGPDEEDAELISAELAMSSGFHDEDFEAKLVVGAGIDPLQIEIDTEYKRGLQYTVSDIEGIIYRKGKFYGSSTLDFNNLKSGRYAVFVFAGRKVVRAFMVEKQADESTIF